MNKTPLSGIQRLFLALVCLAAPAGAAAATDSETVKNNVRNFYVAAGADRTDPALAPALTTLKTRVQGFLTSLKSDGSWADVNYALPPGPSWPLSTQYDRLRQMAQAYTTPGQSLYNDPALKNGIEKALSYGNRYVFKDCPRPGNWWFWDIGVPYYHLGPVLIMLEGKISPAVYTPQMETLDYLVKKPVLSPTLMTGQNLVWVSLAQLFHAALVGDAAALAQVKNKMASVTVVTTGEGIMPDNSFHQHGAQLMTGGYGASYADSVARYFLFVKNTGYVLPAVNFNSFVNYVADGIRWSIAHNYYDPSVMGRSVTRSGANALEGLNAMLFLAGTPNPRQNELTAAAKRMLGTWTGAFSVEMAGLVTPVKQSPLAASGPSGVKTYPWSDYVIHRRDNFFASVKMLSNRMVSAEWVGGEGEKSWYLSDGMTYLALAGHEYFTRNIWPTLDWTRLPGTTVERQVLAPGQGYGPGTKTFVGGAGMGDYGVAAMDFDANASGLTALKSWFFLDDILVAMGSHIACPTGNPVETTVAQWPLSAAAAPLTVDGAAKPAGLGWSETLTHIQWAHADNIGYYFPGRQTLKGQRQNQSGAWSDIGAGGTQIFTNPFLTLLYDHGRSPGRGGYVYALLPNKTASETAAFASENPLVILSSNSSVVHAVMDKRANALGAVFWRSGGLPMLSVNTGCALTYKISGKTVTLAVSNPAQNGAPVALTLKGRLAGKSLPPAAALSSNGVHTSLTIPTTRGETQICQLEFVDPMPSVYGPTPDTTLPTGSLTAPASGAWASGVITLGATASDNVGIAKVEFYNGTTKLGEDATAPYSFSWNTAGVPDGSYYLGLKTYDTAGNARNSPSVNVVVNNAGPGTGLSAVYYDNADFTGVSLSRVDKTVNFDWDTGSPQASLGADTFSARWTGVLMPRHTEAYTFHVVSDDGVRLWVNNQLIVDDWTEHAARERSGAFGYAFHAGRKYSVKLEFMEQSAKATVKLFWSSARQAKEIIPQICLYPAAGAAPAAAAGIQVLGSPALAGPVLAGESSFVTIQLADPEGSPLAQAGPEVFTAALHYSDAAGLYNRSLPMAKVSDGRFAALLDASETGEAGELRYYAAVTGPDNQVLTSPEYVLTFSPRLSLEGRPEPQSRTRVFTAPDANPWDGTLSVQIPQEAVVDTLQIARLPPHDIPGINALAAYEIGPEKQAFTRPATVTLVYHDLEDTDGDGMPEGNGRVDGSQVQESRLQVTAFEGGLWKILGGLVNPTANTIAVKTHGLGIFAVVDGDTLPPPGARAPQKFLSPTLADGINDQAVFGLAAQKVEIFDINGKLVFEAASDEMGQSAIVWTCQDARGRWVPSGVYLARIHQKDGKTLYQSLVVVK